jgi:hypothetical protein
MSCNGLEPLLELLEAPVHVLLKAEGGFSGLRRAKDPVPLAQNRVAATNHYCDDDKL